MFFWQFKYFTACGELNFYTISVLLQKTAADAVAEGPIIAFFQDFENWTLQNLLKMGVSVTSCKSTGVAFGLIF